MPRLLCVIDPEGRPLLSRTYGGMPQPPFPTVALLSTVAGFAENVGMALRRVATSDVRVVFHKASGGLLFILVASDLADSEGHLSGLLKRCEDVAVLTAGRAALDCSARGNGPTKQKPLLRAVCPALDRILEEDHPMPSAVLGTAHVLSKLNRRHNGNGYGDDDDDDDGWESLSAAVADLAVKAGVQHAAMFAHELIAAATPAWDHLPVDDRVALQVRLQASGKFFFFFILRVLVSKYCFFLPAHPPPSLFTPSSLLPPPLGLCLDLRFRLLG